jgi:SAM-dependent methyltransferase
MQLCRRAGLRRSAWALRRLHVPVPRTALVVEVGSGGNPYPRSDILLDAYEDTIERYHAPLIRDRPLVIGTVEQLPFRTKSLDFIIASHVLEHSPDPEAFLGELERAGRAGYIECPDAFFEHVNPYKYHRLEVCAEGGALLITKKPNWRPNDRVVRLYENKVKKASWIRYISTHPDDFHVRFYWSGLIPRAVTNPEVDCAWPLPESSSAGPAARTSSTRLRDLAIRGVTRVLRWRYGRQRVPRTARQAAAI